MLSFSILENICLLVETMNKIFYNPPMAKRYLEVIVASTSEQKLEPTRIVFRTGLLGRRYEAHVRGVKAASEINEQPIGDAEAEQGARNRLLNAQRLAPDGDIWVSMENGVRDVVRRRQTVHEEVLIQQR